MEESTRIGFRGPARYFLISAILTAGAFCGGASAESADNDGEGTIEEVVVTGSYIKGSPTDAPSPVKIFDREQFDIEGAFTIHDVVRNLTVNSGSLGNNESGGIGVSRDLVGVTNVNLRGLGPNSTLTLINGKRIAPVAAQTTTGGEVVDTHSIPSIMTERVEMLLDGGSALYGSDAVAGVFNMIMRNDFEGMEIEMQGGGMTNSLEDSNERVAGIWGWTNDANDMHLVLSAEYYHQHEVSVKKANFFDDSLQQFTGRVGSRIHPILGFPGEQLNQAWVNQDVVAQAIAEGGTGGARLTDPLCSTLTDADGDSLFVGSQFAAKGFPDSQCREDTSEFRQIVTEYERTSIAGNFTYAVNDRTEFYTFFNYSDSTAYPAWDGVTTSPYATYFLAQPGAFGGNPLARGLELGSFAPWVVREGREPLASPTFIPNHPGAGYNGGPNVSAINYLTTGYPRKRSDRHTNEQKAITVQSGVKGDFDFADRTFDYDIGVSYSENSLEASGVHFNRERSELAANGLGGPNCVPNGVDDLDFQSIRYAWGFLNPFDFLGFVTTGSSPENVNNLHQSMSLALTSNNHGVGDCQFFNPYLSSLTDPDLANSDELINWMLEDVMLTDKRNKLGSFDAVISGDLFEMKGGAAKFATGLHYRRENRHSRAGSLLNPEIAAITDAIKSFNSDGPILDENGAVIRESGTVAETHDLISNSLYCDRCSYSFDNDRTVKAMFLELSLPFWENVESQIALRYEDYGDKIGSKVTPKIALSWRPIDTFLLRGSYSESFRAPNVGVVEQGLGSFTQFVQDPLRPQAVRAGILPPSVNNTRGQSVYFVGSPSPNLEPETADTYSFGFQWEPSEIFNGKLKGLQVGLTYWRFEYFDRVGPQPPNEAFDREVAAFLKAAQDPNNYILNHTQQPYQVDEYKESCDPVALSAQYGDGLPADPLADISFPLATTPNPPSPNIFEFPRLNCVVDPATYVVEGVNRTTGTEAVRARIRSIDAISINAGEVVTDGVDLELNYSFDTDWGRFGVRAEYTHVNQYELIDIPGLDDGLLNTGVTDAAGTTGGNGLVRSLPDNRSNVTLWWRGGKYRQHGLYVTNRYIGSYRDLAADAVRENNNEEVAARVRDTIPNYFSWDIHYDYRHTFSNDTALIFSVNVLDATNSELPFRELGTTGLRYDAQAPIDPRGRRVNVVARLVF